jgi:hypothetical protein
MKLCFVSVNGLRETYFVDKPRINDVGEVSAPPIDTSPRKCNLSQILLRSDDDFLSQQFACAVTMPLESTRNRKQTDLKQLLR